MKTRAWIQAFRLKFLPQGVMPVFIGTALAYNAHKLFFFNLFVLVFFGMMFVQFGLTMLDDWHDYMGETDTTGTFEKNPYTGGSGVLVDGTITPKEMIRVVALFYIIALTIGLFVTYLRGAMVLYILLAGFFISIFYSLKPFQFAYRGIGEFMMLLGYGPTITLGAYFVQTQSLSFQAFYAGLLPGMLMWVMIIVNEIPDYEEDRANEKKNLVVRFGREKGVLFFILGLFFVYAFIILLVALAVFPIGVLISLLSIPIAIRSVTHLRKHYTSKIEVSAANNLMVIVYSSTTILFTLGLLL
jgi:1,4-dihydroxy-2-naphthoate octaprenyltransferase